MRLLRRHRTWLPGWLAALLLFMQLATAAYACPKLAQPADGGAVQAVEMADMPDCAGMPVQMDPGQPQLCKAHCETGSSSVNSQSASPDAPAAVAIAAALLGVLDVAQAARRAAALPVSVAHGPPAGAPPLYLSLLVLRN